MKLHIATVIFILLLAGCSLNHPGPITAELSTAAIEPHDNHMLWGEWTFYINADHTQIDITPGRQGRFHLNALKFLEEYCTDCVEVTNITNNGDGTIDLTVRITHPFPDHPQYTGFDVKGIIMFNGSHTVPWWSSLVYPYGEYKDPHYFYISWAETGDPEVLNQDGYTVRWSPSWDSGSSMPIFNYWEGKYSNGTPTANINAYINFYTDEDRHMFRVDGSVDRVYHISLPPGPVIAGYAVEACWEPPLVTPVTDPVNDFPITANQEEPYYFRFVVNNDEPVTEEEISFEYWQDCSGTRYEYSQWHGHAPTNAIESWPESPYWKWNTTTHAGFWPCDQESPPDVLAFFTGTIYKVHQKYGGESGNYRGVAVYYTFGLDFIPYYVAYDVFDFTLDYD